MKLECNWTNQMHFTAEADQHQVEMDAKAPLGKDSALSPKQLVLAGICGCTGMDVVALMRKFKQNLSSFKIECDARQTEGKHPAVFEKVHLIYRFEGELDGAKAMEAVTLSQTKYCGVSAMISQAVPITYSVEVNGQEIGQGQAAFSSVFN